VPAHEVDVPVLPLARLAPVIGQERMARLEAGAAKVVERLSGRTIWQVNSTATGGGVAEMLPVLVGYACDAGADVRWLVIEGDPQFFAITKRLHNRMHGVAGDERTLGEAETAHYAEITAANAETMRELVRPRDIVVLHDPQTAGLVAPLQEHGVHVAWRCHIGADTPNATTDEAWAFLRPLVQGADALVFSRAAYIPDWVPAGTAVVVPPSIDPLSAKNRELIPEEQAEILRTIGLLDDDPARATRAEVVGGPVEADVPLVVQVSRWDRLKDMAGVMRGFVDHIGDMDAVLALVGPDVSGVTDDPEGLAVYEECVAAWEALPDEHRSRVRLITLPMDDVEENAEMVNALQRHAAVVVQKSLAEGFGLTVAEGMWKGRPVIGSAVGGIPDQIAPGTGLLLQDPHDLDAFGRALSDLLGNPERMDEMGAAAHEHVREHFVGDAHLLRWIAVIDDLLN
jgi:trehalose synthase